ncbi:MAG: AmmeMemoRadiSam system protein A [bacterium]
MTDLTQQEKSCLLKLAKDSIRSDLFNTPLEIFEAKNLQNLNKIKATFVTLKEKGELRGCIGNLLPRDPLYVSVIKNAKSAAFNDLRFERLKPDEFDPLDIEISILSPVETFEYQSLDQLLDYLDTNHPGVVLTKDNQQATFLPQVWLDLADPVSFLSQLSLKAGLAQDAWKDNAAIGIFEIDIVR